MSKGGASGGGASSQKLSEKRLRKMESRALEEKLLVLRAALFEPDGKDKDVCAPVAAFMSFDRKGLDVAIEFRARLPADALRFAFQLTKANMEAKYDAAGYGWDDADKYKELSEDGARFLVLRDRATAELVGFAHFRFTVQGDVSDKMVGDTVLMVYDLQLSADARRKGLGRHCVTLLEMVARKTGIARLSMGVMQGDEETRAFVGALKRGAFCPDEDLEDLCGFDADLEGFDVFSLRLANAPRPEAEDDAAATRRTRALLLDSVTAAFSAKHGRAPDAKDLARLEAVIDAKLSGADEGGDDDAPRTGKEKRAKKKERRARAAAAFERAEGRAPTDAELEEVLAVVAPSAAAGTPAKPTAAEAAPSPTTVADVPC